ncbi:MAG: efflux RND transporter periplasmic adaptor subunit [Gammaproteobacteria bacterium]|nr:efflux RND transporter periplasmic adaptor subunit [Gammaproteobacteria bacterium]
MQNNNKNLLLLTTLLASITLTGCSEAPPATPAATKPTPHLVEVDRVEWKPVSTAQERTGSLRSRRLVRIHNQEEGRVIELPHFEGDLVEAGQLLISMEDALLKAQLAKARATTSQAHLDLERISNLVDRRAASKDELARVNTRLEVAQAEQKLLETRLSYTRITAPFRGVISHRYVEPGDAVAKHTHLLTLIDPQSLITEIRISELLLPHIAAGDIAKVRIDALGDEQFTGRVLRIHPELDPATRQGVVEVILDPVPNGARAGQFARVTLETARVQRMLIPFGAVRHDRLGAFVYLLDQENKVRRTPVRSGIRVADQIEILDGLKPDQQVISRGFLGLSDGKQVQITERRPSTTD